VTRDAFVLRAIFDYLIERSPDGTLYPGLATEWSVAEDGVTWTLKLREDVTFHDGTPFNAEAVVYNFDRIVNPDTKSEYAVFQIGPYESSRAVDEFTVEVTMSAPYGPFPTSLATFGMGMISPTAADELGTDFGQAPVGTGAFRFVEWVPQSKLVLERNPDYNWASEQRGGVEGPAQLAGIEFRPIVEDATRAAALMAGEVEFAALAAADYVALEGNSDFEQMVFLLEGYPPPGLFINVTKAPTDDLLVRQALAFAVNRDEVNAVIYEGEAAPADSVISDFAWAYEPESALYTYDLDRAGQLLDEAGWVMGDGEFRQKDGQDLTIVYLSLPGVQQIAELVQAQLKDLGINVELLVQDNPAQQQSAQQGLHNLVWTQWGGVDPADLQKVYGSENIGDGWNFSHYNNPDLDALFVEGVATNDLDARKEIYSKVSMLLMEDATFIPLNNTTRWHGVKAGVKGYDVVDANGASVHLYNFYKES
jgi:peptide/nickel transport system substrate-binding protein